MVIWLIKRLARVVVAVWAIASVAFLLSHFSGMQPELSDLNHLEALDPQTSAEVLTANEQALHHRLALDIPVFYVSREAGPPIRWHWHGAHNQYHNWMRQLLHGRLGVSYRDGQPVGPRIWAALTVTLPLVLPALLLAVASAVLLAHYLAAGSGWGQWLVNLGLVVVQSLPLFALTLGLLLLLANPELLNILPADDLLAAQPSLGNKLAHLVLPLLGLVISSLPELTLPLAAALRHELTQPYAVAARAKGLSVQQILRLHALPNALLPLLAILAGFLPALAAGAVVVEVLFALPGMGRLLAEAVATQDFPVILAGMLLVVATRLLALLITDLAHYWLDPRLRATLP